MRSLAYDTIRAVGRPADVIGTPPDRTCAVTVLVETYNHESFIGPCLDSILGQQFSQQARILVHDDASTDRTAQIVRSYVERHPDRIQAILQQDNQLSVGASPYDYLLTRIVTPYLAFCEGDDEWIDEFKLERQWRFMQSNPWCSISHHEVSIDAVPQAQGYADELRRYLQAHRPDHARTSGLALMDGNWIMTCSTMIRTNALPREIVRVIGPREPSDFILFAIAASHGDIGYLPQPMSRYRLHGANFWSTMPVIERNAREIETLWFLSAHLAGAPRDRIRDRLLEVLAGRDDAVGPGPFRRLRARVEELERDREILLDRVHYLEEREIELVAALGWAAEET